MDEHYRLVFRGEVLDGQHAAVVKKRLIGLLKIDAERGEKLFTGRPVVLVKDADTKTAARYQKAFREVGARLRVLPVDAEVVADAQPAMEPVAESPKALGSTQPTVTPESRSKPTPATPSRSDGTPQRAGPAVVEPAAAAAISNAPSNAEAATHDAVRDTAELTTQMGADVPSAEVPESADEVAVPDFGLAPVGADLVPRVESETDSKDAAPDTSHFTLAAAGTRLSDAAPRFETMEIPDVHFDLLEAGVALGVARDEVEPELVVDVDWDLAEVGADIAPPRPSQAVPPAPSTEHLALLEEELEEELEGA